MKRRNGKKAAENEEKSPGWRGDVPFSVEVSDVPVEAVQEKELQGEVKAESPVKSEESDSKPEVAPVPEPKVESVPEPKVESVPEPKVETIPKPTEEPTKKSPSFVELYNSAKKLFNAQKYEEALDQFGKAIEASPENNSQMKTLVYSHASCLRKLVRVFLRSHRRIVWRRLLRTTPSASSWILSTRVPTRRVRRWR
mgnify:CR=1 FL=1